MCSQIASSFQRSLSKLKKALISPNALANPGAALIAAGYRSQPRHLPQRSLPPTTVKNNRRISNPTPQDPRADRVGSVWGFPSVSPPAPTKEFTPGPMHRRQTFSLYDKPPLWENEEMLEDIQYLTSTYSPDVRPESYGDPFGRAPLGAIPFYYSDAVPSEPASVHGAHPHWRSEEVLSTLISAYYDEEPDSSSYSHASEESDAPAFSTNAAQRACAQTPPPDQPGLTQASDPGYHPAGLALYNVDNVDSRFSAFSEALYSSLETSSTTFPKPERSHAGRSPANSTYSASSRHRGPSWSPHKNEGRVIVPPFPVDELAEDDSRSQPDADWPLQRFPPPPSHWRDRRLSNSSRFTVRTPSCWNGRFEIHSIAEEDDTATPTREHSPLPWLSPQSSASSRCSSMLFDKLASKHFAESDKGSPASEFISVYRDYEQAHTLTYSA